MKVYNNISEISIHFILMVVNRDKCLVYILHLKWSQVIEMEVSENTIGVFYVSKILTLAPYTLTKNVKGRLEIHKNILLYIYSFSLMAIMGNKYCFKIIFKNN